MKAYDKLWRGYRVHSRIRSREAVFTDKNVPGYMGGNFVDLILGAQRHISEIDSID